MSHIAGPPKVDPVEYQQSFVGKTDEETILAVVSDAIINASLLPYDDPRIKGFATRIAQGITSRGVDLKPRWSSGNIPRAAD